MKKQLLFSIAILFALSSFAQTWTKTSAFTNPVNSHTVTVLGNGDVLQVGGDHGFNAYSNDVNLYNVESDTWTAVAPYPTNVQYHTAFATSATTVIVFGGGVDGTSTDAAYEYNSETNEWTAKASLPETLEAISATKLQDGRLFITGGWALPAYSCNDNAYIYDADADNWTTVTTMPEELTNTACVLLGNGDVVVAGGVNSSLTTSSGSYVYNVEEDSWTTAGSLPYALSGVTATSLADGKAAIVGGFDFGTFTFLDKVLIFDASTMVWTELLTLNTSISNCVAVGFNNNTMLVAGGNNGSKKTNTTAGNITLSMLKGIANVDAKASLDAAYIIDLEAGTFKNEDPLTEHRQAPAYAVLNDGRVIVTGGAGAAMADDSYNDGLIYEKSSIVGLINNSASFELTIYPTISTGNITVVSPKNQTITLNIINQLGQIVKTINNVEGTKTIDLNLEQGIYIIAAENNIKAVNVQKIIIQ